MAHPETLGGAGASADCTEHTQRSSVCGEADAKCAGCAHASGARMCPHRDLREAQRGPKWSTGLHLWNSTDRVEASRGQNVSR